MEELRRAKALLENPSLAAKLTSLLGTPIEKGFELLPEEWSIAIRGAVEMSLTRALRLALATLDPKPLRRSFESLHKAAVMGTGGVGGALGLTALPVELPLSTTIMLRSIADIGRSEGEDLSDGDGKLACLEVFAFGGRSSKDNAAETGYYAVRTALASTLAEAARHLAEKGLSVEGAPALVRFVAAVASRFGIAVSEKAAAMAIPAVGAIGGGLINGIFIDHFQNMARGHFKIRKLERRYGKENVRRIYQDFQP